MAAAVPPSWRRRLLDLKAWAFCCLPLHWASAAAHWLSHIEAPPVKKLMIRAFISFCVPRMQEAAVEDPDAYPSLNALFIRELKPEARPWPEDPGALAAPCDSRVSQFGRLEEGRILQAKGQTFTADELLGGRHPEFAQARFATLYLAPDDCHRLYMPFDGRLLEMRHVPGRQFTVAPYAVERIPRLYARNERVASLFEDPDGVPFAVVMVGAVNVASIELSWCGIVAPRRRAVTRWRYAGPSADIRLRRGDELGCFHLGSTAIVLAAHEDRAWAPGLAIGNKLSYGQPLLVPTEEAPAAAGPGPDDGA